MRIAVVLGLAAACSGSTHGVGADANQAAADAPPYEFEHRTTDVLVTPLSVHWSQGDFVCGLESCPAETSGGVLSFTQRTDVTAYTPYELDVAEVGSRQLAGDDQQLFYTVGTALDSMFIKRCDSGDCTALSIPRRLDIGPAVDAINVYWADTLDGTSYTIRRASRGGDGTDATVVVPTIGVNDATRDRLLQASQQLWWIGTSGSLMHVSVTGGTPASAVDHVDTIAAAGDLVLVSRLTGFGTAQPYAEIGTVDVSGTYQALVTLDPNNAPRFLSSAENTVWWSTGDGNIYSAPLAGGVVTPHAVQMADGPQVFAVLPDRFLVDLTAHGLRSVMR
jgi:hypothetical protein